MFYCLPTTDAAFERNTFQIDDKTLLDLDSAEIDIHALIIADMLLFYQRPFAAKISYYRQRQVSKTMQTVCKLLLNVTQLHTCVMLPNHTIKCYLH